MEDKQVRLLLSGDYMKMQLPREIMEQLLKTGEKIGTQVNLFVCLQKDGKGRVKQINRSVAHTVLPAQILHGFARRRVRHRQAECQVRGGNGICDALRVFGLLNGVIALDGGPDRLFHLADIQWLFHIIHSLKANGGLQIFLVGITAHENKDRVRHERMNPFHHFNSGHPGHPHITQDDFRFMNGGLMEPLQTVSGDIDLVDAEPDPVDGGGQSRAGQIFVVYNQKFDGDTSLKNARVWFLFVFSFKSTIYKHMIARNESDSEKILPDSIKNSS